MRVWPGAPHPLGARWDGEGVNFALFSAHATRVELCLYDPGEPGRESARVSLPERTHDVWHGYLPDVRPGQLYGYRAHGPWEPRAGHRFNPSKLLLDPYARAATSAARLEASHFEPDAAARSGTDSADHTPRCAVVDDAFPWGDDRAPRTPWSRTLIYECHVKGTSALHPGVPAPLRGKFLGLASDAIVEHLQSLGVTALELLPVALAQSSRALGARGQANYWGYDTLLYFAPDPRFAGAAGAGAVIEWKSMVKTLHRAGIEVILDVVYNHTGESDERGPTLCYRGIDNASYYRLAPHDRRRYLDFSGCGNALDLRHPRVLQLVVDSLRYWVSEMHVDGFRLDLAPALARDHDGDAFDPNARLFALVQQDPVLAEVKWIAEPWDLGPGGYQLGNFPPGWAEWNGRYRDSLRRFWRGDRGQVPELASRLSGSSDLFLAGGRGPFASVNFVACHDGLTLRDLVSYEHKHNEANGEANRDGSDANWSRNWGAEGETDSREIQELRARIARNLLATLAFSQGVPMLSHGDELGRTQSGNNNAYCHDDATTWLDWRLGPAEQALLDFTRKVFALRRENPVFRRRRFFAGDPLIHAGVKDVTWLRPDGAEMAAADWHDPELDALAMLVRGDASDELDERGRPNRGATLLVLLNGGEQPRRFRLPRLPQRGDWRERVNTGDEDGARPESERVQLGAHALALFEHDGARSA